MLSDPSSVALSDKLTPTDETTTTGELVRGSVQQVNTKSTANATTNVQVSPKAASGPQSQKQEQQQQCFTNALDSVVNMMQNVSSIPPLIKLIPIAFDIDVDNNGVAFKDTMYWNVFESEATVNIDSLATIVAEYIPASSKQRLAPKIAAQIRNQRDNYLTKSTQPGFTIEDTLGATARFEAKLQINVGTTLIQGSFDFPIFPSEDCNPEQTALKICLDTGIDLAFCGPISWEILKQLSKARLSFELESLLKTPSGLSSSPSVEKKESKSPSTQATSIRKTANPTTTADLAATCSEPALNIPCPSNTIFQPGGQANNIIDPIMSPALNYGFDGNIDASNALFMEYASGLSAYGHDMFTFPVSPSSPRHPLSFPYPGGTTNSTQYYPDCPNFIYPQIAPAEGPLKHQLPHPPPPWTNNTTIPMGVMYPHISQHHPLHHHVPPHHHNPQQHPNSRRQYNSSPQGKQQDNNKKNNNSNATNSANTNTSSGPPPPKRRKRETILNYDILDSQIDLIYKNRKLGPSATTPAKPSEKSTNRNEESSSPINSNNEDVDNSSSVDSLGLVKPKSMGLKRQYSATKDFPKKHRGFGASAKIFNEDGAIDFGDSRKSWRCDWCLLSGKYTPTLRKGPLGAKTLCNACGIWFVKHGSLPPDRYGEHI